MAPLLFLALSLAPPATHEPNVVLVTLDTFRGDFLGSLGSKPSATPRLDRLASKGVLFSRARAPVPMTLPSHASLLTGLYPPEHGVRDNGTARLEDAYRTLAEVLAEHGYRTAAFLGSFVLDRRFGLAQGFDLYDDAIETKANDLESPEAERSGDLVVQSFERWLRSRKDEKPFFAWVHLYDAHAPYEPPEPFRSRFANDPYRGEVAFVDSLVGRIVDELPEATLVAVVGDHGEGLTEHDEPTHALLIYNSTLHVPMILAGPGVPEARRVDALVRTIDLAPTLLDYLGFDAAFGEGSSLRGLAEGRTEEPRAAYAESFYGLHHFGFAPLYSIEWGDHHFIDAPARELYDVTTDPGETKNLLQDRRAVSRDLYARLDETRKRMGTSRGGTLELDAETKRKLESLGYVSTRASPSTASSKGLKGIEGLPDPKDHMDLYHRVQLAELAKSKGDCKAVVEALAPLALEDRSPVPVAYELLSSCYLELGDWERAATTARTALARGVDSSALHVDLGVSAMRQGNLSEAEKELRIATTLDPRSVVALYQLGDCYRAERRNDEAIGAYRDALALNPRYAFAWNGLGMTLARTRRDAEALEAFRRVVTLEPGEPRGIFNLAVQLERMGLGDEAREAYRRFLDLATGPELSRERARAQKALESSPPR